MGMHRAGSVRGWQHDQKLVWWRKETNQSRSWIEKRTLPRSLSAGSTLRPFWERGSGEAGDSVRTQ